MEQSIKTLLGLVDDGKRIYRFSDGEVTREEFLYCQIIDQIVFGEKGLVKTLGQTWNMIHDPRFVRIENCFIVNRKSIFGGDSRLGMQWIDDQGDFSSGTNIQQYAEILGEGRFFRTIVIQDGLDPKTFFTQDDSLLWKLIRRECPNYFFKPKPGQVYGGPNREARTLFNLFREDLVGLIHDYCRVALVQEKLNLKTGELLEEEELADPECQWVSMEVDTLEKALSYRASLRMTAAKILRSVGITQVLEEEDQKLTDIEIDELLRIIYKSSWPDDKPQLLMAVMTYLGKTFEAPYEERRKKQLHLCLQDSEAMNAGIEAGTIEIINRETDGMEEEAPEASGGRMGEVVKQILKDPNRWELFTIRSEAQQKLNRLLYDRFLEETSHLEETISLSLAEFQNAFWNEENTDGSAPAVLPEGFAAKTEDELKLKEVVDLLEPVVKDPDLRVTEAIFNLYIKKLYLLSYFTETAAPKTVEGDYEPVLKSRN